MHLTKRDLLKWLSRLPVIGERYRSKLDHSLLKELEQIEARLTNGSATTRFDTQVHDLYDCLKGLEGPLPVNPREFLQIPMVSHTKSSGQAKGLLERLQQGLYINHDEYFVKAGAVRHHSFLDWYSNDESFAEFLDGMRTLLGLYCNLKPRDADGFQYDKKLALCNDVTETFVLSKWFKLVVLDLIQSLTAVLVQRTGG